MKHLIHLWIIAFAFNSSCTSSKKEDSLNIATAANMQFAMKALVEKFTEKTAIKCHLIISSSGKLTAQITEGAPYDVFVAANMKYPQTIYKKGLTPFSPQIYAYGKLVLWTMSPNTHLSLDSLDQYPYIALANPKTAPYGQAAEEVLKQKGLYDQLQERLVYGESITQTNQYITSGAATVGFTALSVVQSATMKNKGQWITISPSLHSPIEQGLVILKQQGKDIKNAQRFCTFIFSKEAKNILKDFGYTVNE